MFSGPNLGDKCQSLFDSKSIGGRSPLRKCCFMRHLTKQNLRLYPYLLVFRIEKLCNLFIIMSNLFVRATGRSGLLSAGVMEGYCIILLYIVSIYVSTSLTRDFLFQNP